MNAWLTHTGLTHRRISADSLTPTQQKKPPPQVLAGDGDTHRMQTSALPRKGSLKQLWAGCLGNTLSKRFDLELKLLYPFRKLILRLSFFQRFKILLDLLSSKNQRHKIMKNLK